MSRADIFRISGAIVGIAGFIIVGIWANWLVAIGIFLMLFGNNLEKSGHKQKMSIYEAHQKLKQKKIARAIKDSWWFADIGSKSD